jgi:hypothetical protein
VVYVHEVVHLHYPCEKELELGHCAPKPEKVDVGVAGSSMVPHSRQLVQLSLCPDHNYPEKHDRGRIDVARKSFGLHDHRSCSRSHSARSASIAEQGGVVALLAPPAVVMAKMQYEADTVRSPGNKGPLALIALLPRVAIWAESCRVMFEDLRVLATMVVGSCSYVWDGRET